MNPGLIKFMVELQNNEHSENKHKGFNVKFQCFKWKNFFKQTAKITVPINKE